VRRKPQTVERCLAFTIAGLILFLVANLFPFLTFKMEFQMRQTTLLTGVVELYRQGYAGVAAVVLLTTFLAPLLHLTAMLALVLPLSLGFMPLWAPHILRMLKSVLPWSMMEIFMLGILVALVKLTQMARIELGVAIYSFFGLICILAALTASLDTHWIWEQWTARRSQKA
jgi:paraquat-inducible protein A